QVNELLREIEPQDLLKYGLIPEFVGRLPVVAVLDELNEHALIKILTEPRNALVKQYQKLFELENVKLNFTDSALAAVAREAMKRKTGARGLRAILENAMLDVMYEMPSQANVRECLVNEDMILGRGTPIMVYEKKAESA
ncbi:MAG TPA: ATP-dependent Clp protease ATP-binding subunit ClpX, partial [Thermodesulfobacteriota bacterium]|nr:ATP-dependent Clp protease ATP-binding subunit ClpX [Thermodesulfobacteriota bacterium]